MAERANTSATDVQQTTGGPPITQTTSRPPGPSDGGTPTSTGGEDLAQTSVTAPDVNKSGETFHATAPNLDSWIHAGPGNPRWKHPDLALFYSTLDGEYTWQGPDGEFHSGKVRPPDSQVKVEHGWDDDDD